MTLGNRTVSYLERTKEDGQTCFLEENANSALTAVANIQLPPVAGLHRIGPRSWSAKRPQIAKNIKTHFRKQCNPTEVQTAFREVLNRKFSTHEVRYTDGSKLAERVGLGIYSRTTEMYHSLPIQCSVFSAEAAAIFLATTTPCDNPMLVVSDSDSVLSAITNPSNRHPFIQKIQEALENPSTRTTFMWVPGHCGILGNERADILAGIGRNSPTLTRTVPRDDIKSWLKERLWTAWSGAWRRNREPFLRKIKNTTSTWQDQPSRREQVVLSRLRTGHTRLSHDMGSTGGGFHRQCETCGTRNTVEHFLINCPILEHLRTIHEITSIDSTLQNDTVKERQLINFLKEAGLFTLI
ncbi:uncharacterized protein LOC134290367 [Aedes albopictus]|uniref:RNase H type-1 domain-containing protein n=1 Tax=Aedes albopictus TaxID=7160 RepID=A0ABM1Z454_AEDAL